MFCTSFYNIMENTKIVICGKHAIKMKCITRDQKVFEHLIIR